MSSVRLPLGPISADASGGPGASLSVRANPEVRLIH